MKEMLPKAIQPYFEMIQGAVFALVIFIAGWIVSKMISKLVLRVLDRRHVDRALARFLSSIVLYALLAATVIAALGAVGVKTTSLVAIFASAGLAVGLALQGNLANFASGVMILFFRPFTLDEVITAGGHTGRVDDIGLFASTLVTPDNEKIIIPNSKVTSGSIVNLTTLGTRRGHVAVGVAYGTDSPEVQKVLVKAAQRAELVLQDPPPAAAFVGFGASSVDYKVFAWCQSMNYVPMLHNLRVAVYEELNAAGIEIPFNQIVVHKAPEAA